MISSMAEASVVFVTLFIYLVFVVQTVSGVDYCNVAGPRTDCHSESGATEERCHNRGCCWKRPPDNTQNEPWCYRPAVGAGGQCAVADAHRADCYPENGATPTTCFSRGCCWGSSNAGRTAFCYYLSNHTGYEMSSVQNTTAGYLASLTKTSETHWSNQVAQLNLNVTLETRSRLRFKFTDASTARYEADINAPIMTSKATVTDYSVRINNSPAGVVVTRKSTGSILFDTSVSPLVYSDQFIQIRTSIPTRYIYGFGEHQHQFWIDPSTSPTFSFWGRDQGPAPNANLYGTHPFFLGIEEDGNAFGVFLLNSNAMEVHVIPTVPITLTYRTIGGILDFYIFTGPSPDDVIKQFSDIVGRTFFPPYWTFGFHLCRWGYRSSSEIKSIINEMRSAQMPYDTQWIDIDYMDQYKDWTYNHSSFGDLPELARDLHNNGQRLVAIVDPGISNQQAAGTYAPYDDGVRDDIFIKNSNRSAILIGSVWPGLTAFPDFTHPNIQQYWTKHHRLFHNQIPFDGIWIDMNEPANFVNGSTVGCIGNSLDNPPYIPDITDRNLVRKTLCPSAQHYSTSHYNVHNMYGYHESLVTKKTLDTILGKRSLVLTRSSFSGTGQYAGHWTGDNTANWEHMYYSIPDMLNFNMFGIPMVGADVCGFFGDSDEELCTRWMQLGAFYPFMRNHNVARAAEQHPTSSRFPNHQDKMKTALNMRYTLLPHFYTLFYKSHMDGSPVVRPLFFQYPRDRTAYGIDRQFLWGSHIMVTPVLTRGAVTVNAYFPRDTWYDMFTGEMMTGGGRLILSAPIDKINVHVRGGVVIPIQKPGVTTTLSRHNEFGLLVALPVSGSAFGELFWDDGESYGTTQNNNNNYITFTATTGEMSSTVVRRDYSGGPMVLGNVRVFGMLTKPAQVTLNRQVVADRDYRYDETNHVLVVANLTQNLLRDFRLTWGTEIIPVGK